MVTSILHRITGVGLYLGGLILAGWAIALAAGPDAFTSYSNLLGSWFGKFVLFGMTVAFFFHLATGVRHLIWDAGKAFDIKSATLGSWICIGFALLASLAFWAALLTK